MGQMNNTDNDSVFIFTRSEIKALLEAAETGSCFNPTALASAVQQLKDPPGYQFHNPKPGRDMWIKKSPAV